MLEAKKTELVTYQGEYTEVEMNDNAAQLRAVEQIYDLCGASIGKQEGSGGSGSVHVHVHVGENGLPSDWIEGQPTQPSLCITQELSINSQVDGQVLDDPDE